MLRKPVVVKNNSVIATCYLSMRSNKNAEGQPFSCGFDIMRMEGMTDTIGCSAEEYYNLLHAIRKIKTGKESVTIGNWKLMKVKEAGSVYCTIGKSGVLISVTKRNFNDFIEAAVSLYENEDVSADLAVSAKCE
ncbi:MAG: hypothetical protein IBX72_10520 [Nitrospirae bacterium]|nr:hypothetical protein [Nitrospirota bacterium]